MCSVKAEMAKCILVLLLLSILVPLCVSDSAWIRESGEKKEEGKNFELTCAVEQGDYSIHTPVIWRKNTHVLAGQTDAVLKFKPLTREDAGVYDCKLDSPSFPDFSDPFSLDLRYRPEVHISLRIKDSSDVSRVQAGQRLVLTCNVTSAHPEATSFSWWYQTTCDSDFSLVTEPYRSSQEWKVPSVRSTDAGCYACAAENEVNISNIAKKMITVDYLEHPCVIAEPSVVEGDDTTVNCTVDSSPTATLELVKDGVTLRKGTGNFISHTIRNISSEATGNVSCRASNDEIPYSWAAMTELVVNHKPRILKKGASEKVGVGLGCNVTLSLTFSAFPQPRITWKYHPDPKNYMRIERAVSTHSETKLVFSEVEERDLGSYCVDLQNDYGRVYYLFTLENDKDSVCNTSPGKDGQTNWLVGFIIVLVLLVGVFIVGLGCIIWKKWTQGSSHHSDDEGEKHEVQSLNKD